MTAWHNVERVGLSAAFATTVAMGEEHNHSEPQSYL